jgi:hypothetical protein
MIIEWPMTPGPLSKILDEDRIGFIEEHGSRDRPVRNGKKKRKGRKK